MVGNDGSDLYVSPIIKDRLRPMTAVLHAEYSYVYVTTLDIHILKAERDESRKTVIAGVLERNLSRIKEGYETIRKHFKTGQHGTEFIKGLSTWIDNTITLAEDTLRCSQRLSQRAPILPMRPSHLKVTTKKTPPSRTAKFPVVFAYNGGIGDRLCNLPALRALATLFDGRLALVCAKGTGTSTIQA